MKSASPELINLLASRQFYSVDLYEFSMSGGGSLYYCGGETDILWNGLTWTAGGTTGPFFERKDNKAKCHWKVGVSVDTLVFDVLPGGATIYGDPFLSAIRQGLFDGAEFMLYRAFMPVYGNTSDGTVLMFAGRVAEIDAGRSIATFTINSHLELLNQNMPRNLYQAGCVNALYDASCGLDPAGFAVSATVSAGSSQTLLNTSTTQASGTFDLGVLAFTSGVNSGLSRTVKSYVLGSPSAVRLVSPFPSIPAAGDSFLIYPGCDKTQSTCGGKFNNLTNFRGFPYIPENSTAV